MWAIVSICGDELRAARRLKLEQKQKPENHTDKCWPKYVNSSSRSFPRFGPKKQDKRLFTEMPWKENEI